MANEKIYTGKTGAQELYKRLKALIPETSDSWKAWSERNGSSADGDDSVYIGQNNTATGDNETYNIGHDNVISGDPAEGTENALAMNLGSMNSIEGEGFNIGKENRSDNFGITVGQRNLATHGALAMGEEVIAHEGSLALGKNGLSTDAPAIKLGGTWYPLGKFSFKYANDMPKYKYVCFTGEEGSKATEEGRWILRLYNREDSARQALVVYGGTSIGCDEVYGHYDGSGQFVQGDPEEPGNSKYGDLKRFAVRHLDGTMELVEWSSISGTQFYVSTTDGGEYDCLYGVVALSSLDDIENYGIYTLDAVSGIAENCPRYVEDAYTVPGTACCFTGDNITLAEIPYEVSAECIRDRLGNMLPFVGPSTGAETEFVDFSVKDFADNFTFNGDVYGYFPAGTSRNIATAGSFTFGSAIRAMGSSIGISARVDSLYKSTERDPNHSNEYIYVHTETGTRSFAGNMYSTSSTITPGSDPDMATVDGGSVLIIDKSGNASSATAGSVGLGSGLTSTGNSVAIGHSGITATGASLAAGYANVIATNGSIALGNTGATADTGSYMFGASSRALKGSMLVGMNGAYASDGSAGIGHGVQVTNGSYSMGAYTCATRGAVAIGRNVTAEDGGIVVATSGSAASLYRTAYGSIVKYVNPDGVQVPVTGSLTLKTGYSVTKVRKLNQTYIYNNVACSVVLGEYGSDGRYNGYEASVALYDQNGNFVSNINMNDTIRSYYGGTSFNEWWRVYDSSTNKYTFVVAYVESSRDNIKNLESLKNYYTVRCRTFMQGNELYVYADGCGYPSDDLVYTSIAMDTCVFGPAANWQYAKLGYTDQDWKALTGRGAYKQGIAIGQQAHAGTSSIALSTNESDTCSDKVYIENFLYSDGVGLPTSLNFRVCSDYTHAEGQSFAMGSNVLAEETSLAIGHSGVTAYGNSISIGHSTNSAEKKSFAIGYESNLATNRSFAIGLSDNYASGGSFAIGMSGNKAQGYSMAFGYSNSATDMSYAFGKLCAAETYSLSYGTSAYAYGNSMSVGNYAKSFDYSVSFGRNTMASENSIAFGDGAVASSGSVALGLSGTATSGSISVGASNAASSSAIAFGRSNMAMGKTLTLGESNSVAGGSSFGTLVGHSNSMGTNGYNTAVGINNAVGYESIALGGDNQAYGWSIAIGKGNTSANALGGHATMIGYNNSSRYYQEELVWSDDRISTSAFVPTHTNFNYSWTEQIYTADEIGQPGVINALSFNIDSVPSNPQRNLQIYLVETDKTTFASVTDWITVDSSATLVFSGTVTFAYGWTRIPFSTNFEYDGESNLCVIVLDSTGTYTGSMMAKCLRSGDTELNAMVYYNDYTRPDPTSTSLDGSRLNFRPEIKLEIDEAVAMVPEVEYLTGNVPTDSILLGALNKSNHYNSIMIGVGNMSDQPHVIGDGYHYDTTDDDGFMIAIGRENYVGRNYDIAIGYKSIAYGGENVALQHSTARGFGNVAIEQSTVAYGIRNLAMFDSVLSSKSDGEEIKFNKQVVVNVLVDSTLDGKNASAEYMTLNTLMHTNLSTTASDTSRNILCIGDRGIHPVTVSGAATFDDNIIIGTKDDSKYIPYNGEIRFTSSGGSICRNVMISNEYAPVNVGSFNNNVFLSSAIDLATTNANSPISVQDNLVAHSLFQSFSDNSLTLSGNVVLGVSELVGRTHGYYSETVAHNFVFSSRMDYEANTEVNNWITANSIQALNNNVLFGSSVRRSTLCFSFGETTLGQATDEYPKPTYLEYCRNVVNFGNNSISDTEDAFVYGLENRLARTRKGIMFGNHNTVSVDSAANAELNRLCLVGNDNEVVVTYGADGEDRSSCAGIAVIGDNNVARHGHYVFDNRIIGNNNYLASYDTNGGLQKWTAEQVNSITAVGHDRMFSPVDHCILIDGTTRSLWKNYYYYYYGNAISYSETIPAGTSYTEMTATEFSAAYTGGTLTDGDYYKVTTAGSNLPLMNTGDILDPATIYFIEAESTWVAPLDPSDWKYSAAKYGIISYLDAHNASRNVIIGDVNGVYSNTVGYFVLGSENKVRNTQVSQLRGAYAISNGFVQGNCNEAVDGSNIVIMGNGNKAAGHNSVAIGSQLISAQWQTVVGKYNAAVAGPGRLSDPANEGDKALFIVGNGYGESTGEDWMDESRIHRSNAMVVYADGTVTAHEFVGDNDLSLEGQNGISVTADLANSRAVISLDTDTADLVSFLKTRPVSGRYVLQSNDGVLSWVAIGVA